MSDESDVSTASNTDNSHNLEDMAQKRKAAENRSAWPHKCDVDFYDRCEELGLCEDCGCINLVLATDGEKADEQHLLCRCDEIYEHITKPAAK